MATVHSDTAADGIALGFGIAYDEGTLITNKVSVSSKTKKKDLRGRNGGYKCIATFNKTLDVSIDGALIGAGTTGFTLGSTYTLLNDEFSLGVPVFVESITFNEKNEDFKRCSVKLVANENMSSVDTTTAP
jgi:hypothetical protein